jgi:hypothetical protein
MAQQTAVEWLIEQLIPKDQHEGIMDIIEDAKQMEKEQRIKDYNAGYTDAQCNHVNDAENYANEQDYLNG